MIEDLAQRDIEVLDRIANYGAPTVTTLKESIHWADKNQHIHYRVEKLEKSGLVKSWQDPDVDTPGPLDAKRVSLTDEGEELEEEVDGGHLPDSVDARLTRLENQMQPVRDTYGEMKKRVAEIEQDLEEVGADVDDVAEDLADLRRYVEQESGGLTGEEFEFPGDD